MRESAAKTGASPLFPAARALLLRAALFALLWLVLAEGETGSWSIGLPAVVIAALLSLRLLPPATLSLRGIALLPPFFLWHSLRGGIDVAWRALHPRMPIDPTLVEYRLRLQSVLQRACMIDIVSLLPGTLSATLEGDTLTVHVLNRHAGIASDLSSLESVIAGIFGASLGDSES